MLVPWLLMLGMIAALILLLIFGPELAQIRSERSWTSDPID
jgi:hypothetical protein